jgi:hypothetical protein
MIHTIGPLLRALWGIDIGRVNDIWAVGDAVTDREVQGATRSSGCTRYHECHCLPRTQGQSEDCLVMPPWYNCQPTRSLGASQDNPNKSRYRSRFMIDAITSVALAVVNFM